MIALLTDFGHSDCLGTAKGAMKSISPDSELVDLTNEIAPFQVRSAAWVLLKDYKYFPKGTVFYCVVDPGVGGKRKAVAVKTANYFFVGPDNGLLYPAAKADKTEKIVELAVPESASKTFHGRDVFAPAAAKLDKGIAISSLGKTITMLKQLDVISSKHEGEVVMLEHYGNITTNIEKNSPKSSYKVSCNKFKKNLKFHSTFDEAVEGELFVFVGSKGTFEIAVNKGSAVQVINCRVGDKISIK